MHLGTITKKWLVKSVTMITALVVFAILFLSLAVHRFYYNTAQSVLRSGYNNIVSRYFTLNAGDTDDSFNRAAVGYIDIYSLGDTVDVWVIDRHGKVVANSDGFAVADGTEMPDYQAALTAQSSRNFWTGRNACGEKIMAMTVLLKAPADGTAPALRYMISLEKLDAQIRRYVILMVLAGIAALVLTILPGTIYIEKLVRTIRKTTDAADRIADGDYTAHIDYTDKDEIGSLCDAVHDMAQQIGAADQMKNEFISTVSHELRTPLTAIRGWGETLRDVGAEDPALAEKGMRVILSQTARLNGMVEDLLDFSRMQDGRLKLRLVSMDLFAQLEEAALTFHERALREGKQFTYDIPDEAAPMTGDPERLMQVFVNIIDNAIKYTEKDGAVRVEAALEDAHIRITVADTGKGISADDLPHIKEKFYKADTTVRGSGIGLAVADEIIRLHGGELQIDSELGKGTRVTVLLPKTQKAERSTSGEQKER